MGNIISNHSIGIYLFLPFEEDNTWECRWGSVTYPCGFLCGRAVERNGIARRLFCSSSLTIFDLLLLPASIAFFHGVVITNMTLPLWVRPNEVVDTQL